MAQIKPQKNGKIEFYRFVCCLFVLFFHVEKYIMGEPSLEEGAHLAFFPHGSVCVEFFFILSGFFMAKSIHKKITNPDVCNDDKSRAKECLGYLKGKYLRIFPQHMLAFVCTFVVYCVVNTLGFIEIVTLLADSVPNIFLIQMSGVSLRNVNHVEWYISCMLISMAILYPICRRYYYQFTHCFAPLICLLLCGYMLYTTQSLSGVATWMGITYKSVLRSIAEVAVGTTTYELSRYIMKRYEENKTIWKRLGVTLGELLCFAYLVIYVIYTFPKKYEVYIIPILVLLIALGYSGISLGSKLFNCKFIYFLGELSLYVYLTQLAAIYITETTMKNTVKGCQYSIALTFIFAIGIFIVDKGIKQIKKLKCKGI